MPVWPKSIYRFGLSLKTAETEWRLRQTTSAPAAQARAFRSLISTHAKAGVWRRAGIEAGMRYPAFQRQVPLSSHHQMAPAIDRMMRGEPDLLCAGRCTLFVRSSGATTGKPEHLPLTERMLAHFRDGWRDALCYHATRARQAGIFRGRHLLGGGSTALTPLPDTPTHTAYSTKIAGVLHLTLSPSAEKYFDEPGMATAEIPDWQTRLAAIASRTVDRDVSLIAGLPNWTLALGAALCTQRASAGRRPENLQALWPNLECFVHRGTSVAPYHEELRSLLGPTVKFHEVYLAPEGVFAAQDGEPAAGLRLMADQGVFFEFLPLADYDQARLDQLGPKAVPLTGVKPGVPYVLVVTTPAGLARYVVGDIVQFTSVTPPRLVYGGRANLRLNAFGEGVIERELTDALVSVCQRQAWAIVNFHVAPLFAKNFTGPNRGRHEWWIELKPGTHATPTGPQIASQLDAELTRENPDYAARRRAGTMEAPFVRLVMPGVFEHWLKYLGQWGGEHKLHRCRSDRSSAEQLARITNFASDDL